MALNINDISQSPEQKKLAYVETQIDEMESIMLRNEVDIYINENAKWDDSEKDDVATKVFQQKKQNKTLQKAVDALNELHTELTSK